MARKTVKPTIDQMVGNLPFAETVDMMLLEGTPPSQVAHFIQGDQSSLMEINHGTLTTSLSRRKARIVAQLDDDGDPDTVPEVIENESEWFNSGPSIDVRSGPMRPSILAKGAYKRIEEGIDEVHELEALFLAQRDRIDRLIVMEDSVGAFHDKASQEMSVAADILIKRITAKEKIGLLGNSKSKEIKDLRGYAKKTAEVLSRPDSRRRVISIVERIERGMEDKRKLREAAEAAEDSDPKESSGDE